MTPRSLFNVVIKIFGLFFLREIVFAIPQLLSSITFFFQPNDIGNNQYQNYGLASVILAALILAFYCFIVYKLIIKTNSIIDLLKLDKGFNQEEFSFKISTSQILTIALIVVAAVILLEEIPNFCRGVFSYFQEKSMTHGMTKPNYSYIIVSSVKIILGLLIIGERKRIVAFAETRQVKKEANKIDDEIDSAT